MTKTILSILCSLIVFCAYGQKAKIKKQKVLVKYHMLPEKGFDPSITVYSVDLNANENALQFLGFTKSGIEKQIKVSGYSKIAEPVGAVVSLNLVGPSGSPLKLNTIKKKDKNDKIYRQYNYSVNFEGYMKVKVMDPQGKILFEDVVSYSKTEKSGTYSSTSALKKNFDSEEFYKNNRAKALKSLISSAQRLINTQFGIRPVKEKTSYMRLASKKHPDFAEWKKYEEQIEKASETLTASDNSKFIEMSEEAIDFWKEKESTYDASDKYQKKLKAAALVNLFLAHIYREEYDKAKTYAQKLIDTKVDEKKGKKLLKQHESITNGLKRLNRPKRYITIEKGEDIDELIEQADQELQAAIDAGDIIAFPDFEEKMKITSNTIVAKGQITLKNDKVYEGYWAYEGELEAGTPDFRDSKKMRFGYNQGGKIDVAHPKMETFKSVKFDDVTYKIQDVKIGSGLLSLKLKNAVTREFMDFKRTTLLYAVPSYRRGTLSSGEDLRGEVLIYNKKKKKYFSNRTMLGAMRKALMKVVEGCPVAVEYLEDENSGKGTTYQEKLGLYNADIMVETLKLYDTCGK